ncbi:hypothetical protein Glove_66g109 [Diversispora epigaea]|uniref:Uncharacterized protein n=1 Tax=Diversispora epigaea TaxID=1348612 RepID=A0A397JKF3_9GLOM|nr:hypothetical protein Glove_66g109 [Diversispora epigaea]
MTRRRKPFFKGPSLFNCSNQLNAKLCLDVVGLMNVKVKESIGKSNIRIYNSTSSSLQNKSTRENNINKKFVNGENESEKQKFVMLRNQSWKIFTLKTINNINNSDNYNENDDNNNQQQEDEMMKENETEDNINEFKWDVNSSHYHHNYHSSLLITTVIANSAATTQIVLLIIIIDEVSSIIPTTTTIKIANTTNNANASNDATPIMTIMI